MGPLTYSPPSRALFLPASGSHVPPRGYRPLLLPSPRPSGSPREAYRRQSAHHEPDRKHGVDCRRCSNSDVVRIPSSLFPQDSTFLISAAFGVSSHAGTLRKYLSQATLPVESCSETRRPIVRIWMLVSHCPSLTHRDVAPC
jgi:hypothetical protein